MATTLIINQGKWIKFVWKQRRYDDTRMTRYIIDYLLLRAYSLTIPLDVTNKPTDCGPKIHFF